ncbi:MAG: uracil-DNA glycosylase family protein [Alphaproteobacteria bacterium]|nr:uracil-DNA glycosylase family protein [Alphaproteobacteria bacterium]
MAQQKVEYDFPSSPEGWNGLALVGEAPGADEVRLGHPFVGRSGQLLDKILQKAAIDRKRCLVANVFRFQPPGNKVDHFFISRRAAVQQNIPITEEFGKFGSTFCRAEFAPELEHLRATLARMKKNHPRMVVVALGRTPLWALTGENGLLDKVGKILPCRLVPDMDVIPTFHPSFILRGNWGLQDEWVGHFLIAKKYII